MIRFFLLPATFLLLVSCGQNPTSTSAAPPADAVAAVGETFLRQSDLDHALGQAGARPPADVLRLLAEEESLAQLAISEGLDQDPSVRASIRRMLAARVSEKHTAAAPVSDEEVAAAIKATPQPAAKSKLHLAFLRQQVENAGSMEAADGKLEEARAAWSALPEAERAKGFGTLAVTFSDDADTRYQGGDAGWITAGDRHVLLPAEATAAAAAMEKTGLVAEILHTQGAAWLVLVMEKAASSPPKTSTETVRAGLAASHAAQARKALTEKALQVSPIRILKAQPTGPPAAPASPLPPGGP